MEAHDSHDASLDEPKTPMWLPALGGVLFLFAGIWWATRPVPQAPPAVTAPSASVVASASASAPPVVASAQPAMSAPVIPMGGRPTMPRMRH